MGEFVPWSQAWEHALYGDGGFFRTGRPSDHFETAPQIPAFAGAIAELASRCNAQQVVDLAAGGGELIAALRSLLPDTELIGVDLAERPTDLNASIEWRNEMPERIHGLVVANEWLDNIPCDVVEVDHDGIPRRVNVDPSTGDESLAGPVADHWLDAWWPLTAPGQRAEIGAPRDAAWADVVARVEGVAVAIDYGHHRTTRPEFGSLRSYAHGSECEVVPDGSRDITAHVAVDSVAAAASAQLLHQSSALTSLGLSGTRPSIDLARHDPAAYLRHLSDASLAAHLTADGGYGEFWWIVTDTTGSATLTA